MTESTKKENGNEKKPNILIIMTDQQRFDSLSCYGNAGVSTPNLDRLGGEGVQFDNCYANNPICTPSRASMLTGKRITGHGVCRLHDVLPDDEVLLPEVLREHGYHTALFGKLHVSGRIFEERQRAEHDGFDIYEWCMEPSISLESPYNGYAAWLKQKDPDFFRELKEKGRKLLHVPREYHMSHWAAERTIDLINSSEKKEQPFFCLMSVFDPHNPYEDYPEEYAERVDLNQLPEVISLKDEEGEQKSDSISVIETERTHAYFGSAYEIDEKQRDAIRLGYYASIALLDDEVGRVLDALDKKGIAEETMVIFLSDHGDMIGDHDLFVKGAALYDPVVKVPCLMRWPGKIPQGVRDAGLVQPSDIYSTCLSAAGIAEHENPQDGERFDSLDLLQVWKDNPEPSESKQQDSLRRDKRKFAVCEYLNTGINDRGEYWDPNLYSVMIRNERYKMNVYQKGSEEVQFQLFDMLEDPKELKNLHTDSKLGEVKETMMLDLISWYMQGTRNQSGRGGNAFPDPSQKIANAFKKS